MIELLAKLLSKFLLPMGVSYADILVYLNAASNYLLVIALALVILVLALIAERKIPKGWRWFARCQSVVAFLVVTAISVNALCYGPLKATLSAYMNASKVELAEDTVAQSLATIERIGEEGIVLLKNENGALPLGRETKNVNVFGWAATQPYVGGTGSSASSAAPAVDILQSLTDAGYAYNETLISLYRDYAAERPAADMFGQNLTLPEPVADAYTDAVMEEAKAFSDTAIVVIARGGGENYDLPADMKAVIDGAYNVSGEVSIAPETYPYTKVTYTNNGDYDDFDAGESYLELSNTEEAMLQKVCDAFDRVIVVVNSCNSMELGWVDQYAVDAVLLVPAAGATGFKALGKILSGEVNPSGRTADTFVYDLLNTPSIHNIGLNVYDGAQELAEQILKKDATYQGAVSFVNYAEGIYVGYKYYETAADDGVIRYDEQVQYPFGYGLSYTTFDKHIERFSDEGDALALTVSVTNTGSVAGRDVVEIYYTPPYTNGGIEKASVNLIDFAKTSLLAPGATELIYFSLAKEDMASYDSEQIKSPDGGYILEAGEYAVSVRADSHTVCDAYTFRVEQDIRYDTVARASDDAPAVNRFDGARGDFTALSRADGFANYEEACGRTAQRRALDEAAREAVLAQTAAGYDAKAFEKEGDEMPTLGADNGLALADMTGLSYDDPQWDALLDQLSWKDMDTLINQGGWSTAEIASIGKIKTSDSDGPAGLNNYMTGAYGTTYPSEVLMAQTWNKALAHEIGMSMGSEFAAAENFGWYGPALNIHRSAFGGRNFEYYSEDAVLSGLLAAQQIDGAAQFGVYAYVKHFALNDQEINRTAMLLTWATEQTIRENYLKAFELALKRYTGQSIAVMSAYNWIGTTPACASEALLRGVLRDEWGFRGMVITDYDGSYGFMITDNCVRNGGDMMLGFGSYDTNNLNRKYETLAQDMRTACKNILYTVANSGYYADDAQAETVNHMDALFLRLNTGLLAALAAVELVLWLAKGLAGRSARKRRKEA